jgi:hypothetical protein
MNSNTYSNSSATTNKFPVLFGSFASSGFTLIFIGPGGFTHTIFDFPKCIGPMVHTHSAGFHPILDIINVVAARITPKGACAQGASSRVLSHTISHLVYRLPATDVAHAQTTPDFVILVVGARTW